MDSEYDRVRAVRDKQYEYIFNYMPEKPYYQNIEYRLGIPLMNEILQLRDSKKLEPAQQAWFKTKPIEELYDLEKDPHQLTNLALDPEYFGKLQELRTAFENWSSKVGDLGSIPERELVSQWWNGNDKPPETLTPQIIETSDGLKIECATNGASIGYLIAYSKSTVANKHKIVSWDFPMLTSSLKNGNEQIAQASWKIYTGSPINIEKGDTLKVRAMRIGFQEAHAQFVK